MIVTISRRSSLLPLPRIGLSSQRVRFANSNASSNKKGSPAESTPVDKFFALYSNFDYQRTAPVSDEFRRMCKSFGWVAEDGKSQRLGASGRKRLEDKGKKAGAAVSSTDKKLRNAEDAFQAALVEQFNLLYGTDDKDIANWRRLCQVLSIEAPRKLKACQEVVKRTHVNIVDLVDHAMNGTEVHRFNTEKELRDYTLERLRFFPKNGPGAGSVLRHLRRRIINLQERPE